MPDKDALVRGYAEALFSVAQAEGETALVEDQLYAFAKAVEGDQRLREALVDPGLPAENKKRLVADVLEHANPNAVHLLDLLIDQGRFRDIVSIIEEMAAIAAERRQHVVGEVRTAVPLEDAQRERLTRALSRATGKTVELKVVVDPSVVGGVLAKVGDQVIDGTVRARLNEARRQLAQT